MASKHAAKAKYPSGTVLLKHLKYHQKLETMRTSTEHYQNTTFNASDNFEQFQDSTNPFQAKSKNADQATSSTPGKRRRILKPLYSVRLS